uniref:Uncharacterized protein n=1 Tax=Rhizophora mucronata TaxID=61149 RepID=A0A2P2QVF9_RHIMU
MPVQKSTDITNCTRFLLWQPKSAKNSTIHIATMMQS